MTVKPEKILYTAHATSTGGRDGTSKSDDGVLDLKLTTPKGLGGNGAVGTNPEQLFAAGYSACFIGAMKAVAGKQKIKLPDDTSIDASVGHRPDPARLRHPGLAEGPHPRHGQGAGAEDRRGRARGLPVLERDPRQRRGHARGGLAARVAAAARRGAPAAAAAQLDPRLHRRERAGRGERATARPSPRRRRRGSASPQHRQPRRQRRLLERRRELAMDRAVAGGGDDEAVDARGDQRARPRGHRRRRALVDDLDPRPGRSRRRQQLEAEAGLRGHGAAPSRPASTRPSGPASPDANASSRDEWALRTSRAACTVPAKTTTHAARARLGGDGDRVGEVARPVGLARGRRAASPPVSTTGLAGGHDAVQEVRRLLQRVGAMGDDDAGDLGPRRMVGHPLREPLPGGEIHVLAVELRDLLGLDRARRPAPASRGDQRVDADACRRRSRGCRRAMRRCRRSFRRCRGRRRSGRGLCIIRRTG